MVRVAVMADWRVGGCNQASGFVVGINDMSHQWLLLRNMMRHKQQNGDG
jgi:hypothetical protein